MTHDDLVNLAVRWCRSKHRCKLVFAELMTRRTRKIIPDVLGFKPNGDSVLVECKTSKPDFVADQKKKHKGKRRGPGLERWYLTAGHLVEPHEVPVGWGLAEVKSGRVYIKKVPAVTKRDVNSPTRRKDELLMLMAVVNRHELGVEWYQDKARFKPMRKS